MFFLTSASELLNVGFFLWVDLFREWRTGFNSSCTFGLTQKNQKVKAGKFPKRSLRLRGTNPRPRLEGYQLMNRPQPAWLWIRKAPLLLTNREFKADPFQS